MIPRCRPHARNCPAAETALRASFWDKEWKEKPDQEEGLMGEQTFKPKTVSCPRPQA